jgi:ABC-type antimicrobial peptide transport system permease subunit
MVIVTLLTGIISGIYPAFILSSLNPSTIFGKSLHGRFSGAFVIRTLIVFQFMISTGLIISTIIISEQLNYIRNKKLGFEKDHIVVLPLREDYTRKNYEILKNALLQDPKISSISASSVLPGDVKYYSSVSWDGSGYDKTMDFIFADYDFLKTYKVEIAQGRDFSKDFGSDLKNGYILNEEAVKEIGWKEPIGKKFNDGYVIGIVKNFHYKSLFEPVKPLFISVNPDNINFLSIRINSKNVTASLDYIQQSWKGIFPQSPFEYFFFDNHLDKLYKSETKFASIFNWFSGLAIMISCLGLIGLTSISVVKKTKEIGIRKVLGESVEGIVFMITKEFVIIIFVANIIAWPAAYYFMSKWLQDFAYRIDISIWIFIISGGIALLIALFTVGYQAVKAALANPVKSLRYE